MENFSQIDAYQTLGLTPTASEENIKKAYSTLTFKAQDSELLHKSYELIKDEKARQHYYWNSIHSYFCSPEEPKTENDSLGALALEIAFLSDWELEDLD